MGEGGTKITVGEVYWVRFRPADGHEQAGRRPAIILQDADVGGDLPTVLAVPLTSTPAARRFAGTVVIEATPENGLREESLAMLFQLTAVDRVRVEDKMGEIRAYPKNRVLRPFPTSRDAQSHALRLLRRSAPRNDIIFGIGSKPRDFGFAF